LHYSKNLALGQEKKRIMVLCGDEAPAITAANIYADCLRDHDVRFLEEKILTLGRILRFSRRRLRSLGFISLLGSCLFFLPQCFGLRKTPVKRYRPSLVSNDFSTDPRIADFVRDFKPDVVLVGFCGLLSRNFLRLLPCICFNIHPGINPRYRGFGNIWAFYEDNPGCVGYTIHEVDEGTDTGRRVVVTGLDPRSDFKGVSFLDIDIHAAGLAAQRLCNLLLGREDVPAIADQFHGLPSVLYGAPTLPVFLRALRNYYRAVQKGTKTRDA
jgi:hypothetical protein